MSFSSSTNGSEASSGEAPSQALYDVGPGNESSFQETVEILWNGKGLILILALLLGAGAYVYWQHQPKTYQVSSVILLQEQKQIGALDLPFSEDPATKTSRALYYLRHSREIARTVAGRLVERIGPVKTREATLLRTENGTVRSASALARRLPSIIQVRRDDREVPAIKISVTTPYPGEAALLTNEYARAYVDHARQSGNLRVRNSRQFLDDQKARLKQRLEAIEDSMTAYMREQGQTNGLSPTDSGTGTVGEAHQIADEVADLRVRKEEVELELNVERATLDSTRARLRRIRPNLSKRASSNTAERLDRTQERIGRLQTRIQEIEVQNEELDDDLRDELGRMKDRVETLQNQSKDLAETYVQQALATDGVDPLQGEGDGLSRVVRLRREITNHQITITKLEARRAALESRLETRQAMLRKSPDRTLGRLKRRQDMTEELLVAVSKNLHSTRATEQSIAHPAEILRRARPPFGPVGPTVWRNVFMIFVVGGLLGTGLVFTYHRLDNRIDRPEDVEVRSVGLFGTVPQWSAEAPSSESEVSSSHPTSHEGPLPGEADIVAPETAAAEAYRHIATNIQLGIPDSIETLLVTSPHARDGKTTTTLNLAVALCEAGEDVLVVDADLHGPSLHRQLGGDRAPGLSDCLVWGADAVRPVDLPHRRPATFRGDGAPVRVPDEPWGDYAGRLGMLPAGTKVPQPSLLLQEKHVRALQRDLRREWDLLLLDTPPVLAYDTASRLAAVSDMVVLVAAAGETHRSAYVEAAGRLESLCGGPVAGVLNQYSPPSGDLYGSDYSSYVSRENAEQPNSLLSRTEREFRRLAKGQ